MHVDRASHNVHSADTHCLQEHYFDRTVDHVVTLLVPKSVHVSLMMYFGGPKFKRTALLSCALSLYLFFAQTYRPQPT